MLSYLCRSFGNEYKAVVINKEAIQNLQRLKRSNIKDSFFHGCTVCTSMYCCAHNGVMWAALIATGLAFLCLAPWLSYGALHSWLFPLFLHLEVFSSWADCDRDCLLPGLWATLKKTRHPAGYLKSTSLIKWYLMLSIFRFQSFITTHEITLS